jgi:hypothetical protein
MANLAEELASKAMGAMKMGKAALTGLSGVFSKLEQEHGEVTALLMRVKASSDPGVRAELFPKIRAELLSHEKGELLVVYPALREFTDTAGIADKHDMEASQLQKTLDALTGTAYDDPSWEPQFIALIDLVQRHVAEEEGDWFPKAQAVLGDRTDALRAQFEQVKQDTLRALG